MKIVAFSDIHCGQPKINQFKLYTSFQKYVFPQLMDCQLLVIPGDFFDTLITINDEASYYALKIISDIFKLAMEYNFKIRIIRGTWYHDRNQNKIFESIIKNFDNLDYKYFDKISFEYLEKEDLKIIYLPDELSYKTSSKCISFLKNKMKKLGWSSVDLVFGHGYFKHVLPFGIQREPACTFNINQFENIVTGFIIFGHIHTFSATKNMAYIGSFERFSHGEEEKKGFLTLNIDKDKKYHLSFIENKDATPFYTFNLKDNFSVDKNIAFIKDKINNKIESLNLNLDKKSIDRMYVRLSHSDNTVRGNVRKYLERYFKDKNIIFTEHNLKSEKYEKITIENFFTELENDIIPTENNLARLASDFIKSEFLYDLSEDKINTLITKLKETNDYA